MNKTLRFAFFALIILISGSGCTSSLRLQVLRPADISVPKDIQTLALVNRYKPEKNQVGLNIIEGLLSGEGIGNDRRGAEAALDGLTNALSGSPRFSTVRPPIDLKGSGTQFFPEPLKAEEVRGLCDTYKANAIVTVEAFDSDSKLEYIQGTKKVKQNNVDVTVPWVTCRGTINVTVGWRIYHSFDGSLLDEFTMQQSVQFTGEGPTNVGAAANMPSRDQMVRRVGDVLGQAYATRISPAYIWVNRDWYTKAKGNTHMKTGKRFMQADNWAKAREAYLRASQDGDPKVQGRALYNLALLAEVDGDLQGAMRYCDDAIEKGCKDAIQYRRVLENRQYDENRLNQQMEGK